MKPNSTQESAAIWVCLAVLAFWVIAIQLDAAWTQAVLKAMCRESYDDLCDLIP